MGSDLAGGGLGGEPSAGGSSGTDRAGGTDIAVGAGPAGCGLEPAFAPDGLIGAAELGGFASDPHADTTATKRQRARIGTVLEDMATG